MELEKRRVKWQAEQVRKDDKREVRFMTFMKDVFQCLYIHHLYYPSMQSMYPFPPVPPPIPQNDEEDDDEK